MCLKIVTVHLEPVRKNSWCQELLHSGTAGTERVNNEMSALSASGATSHWPQKVQA